MIKFQAMQRRRTMQLSLRASHTEARECLSLAGGRYIESIGYRMQLWRLPLHLDEQRRLDLNEQEKALT